MSASLVGSEMCIRDRTSPAGASPITWRSASSTLRRSTASTSWTSSWPVSYTHLTLPTICSV
eukprot:7369462-Alexandrium_andersonii.AAC.1